MSFVDGRLVNQSQQRRRLDLSAITIELHVIFCSSKSHDFPGVIVDLNDAPVVVGPALAGKRRVQSGYLRRQKRVIHPGIYPKILTPRPDYRTRGLVLGVHDITIKNHSIQMIHSDQRILSKAMTPREELEE